MRCTCGGDSEVLERRGLRRRRRCRVCGHRWSTIEVRVGVKPPSLPPSLAKLGTPATQEQHAKEVTEVKEANLLRRRDIYDDPGEDDDDTNDYLHQNLPEIFDHE